MDRWSAILTLLAASCGPASVATKQGVHAGVPEGARCETVERTVAKAAFVGGELVQLPTEAVSWIACNTGDGSLQHGAARLGPMEPSIALEVRLLGNLQDEFDRPAGPVAESVATLSGIPATEHRVPYHTAVGPKTRILRYVRRGDTLYYAYAMGKADAMAATEADNLAWLDTVRFDDLAP